jgi:multidrug resistance efflux pump
LVAIMVCVLLFVPLVRDRENAYFVIEPSQTSQVHAGVPGRVLAVYVSEGEAVRQGQVMASLRSLNEAGARDQAAAQLSSSQARVFLAELHHSGLADALVSQQAARSDYATAREEGAQLDVRAPLTGVVTSENPENLLDRDVATGETLLTIVDPAHLVARLYIPVSEMDRIRVADPVSLQLPFQFSQMHGRLGMIDGAAQPLPPGILAGQEYKGLAQPTFYTTRMPLPEAAAGIQPGMSGQAKIFSGRRSLAARIGRSLSNVLHTHFW